MKRDTAGLSVPRGRSGRELGATLAIGVATGLLVAASVGGFGGAWRAAPALDPSPAGVLAAAGLAATALLGAVWLLASRRGKVAAILARDAELARLSWRLEFALSASEVGVWDVDLKTDELIWDDRARALFGVERKDGYFGEADWIGVIHPEDRERAMAAADVAIADDGRFVSDYRVVLPDGRTRHVRDIAAVYRGDDGSHRLVGLVWDVSADVARQEELALRQVEAEAATSAKSRFLAAMTHEIRTPMTGVLGMLDLMLREPLGERQRQRAGIARTSAQGLLQILNGILDHAKLEARQLRVHDESVMPRQVIGEVMDLMAAGAEQKGLRLGCVISPTVPTWIGIDAMRLRQVLTNLVSNATKFTETGTIEVRVDHVPTAGGGDLRIEVEDTGIGIAPEDCDRLFERFVQADTSLSRRAGGTGLGLAISKQLVELMGGQIALRSVPGRGSTFSFTVQVRPGVPAASGPETGLEIRATQIAEPDVPPMRILLAEDNPTNQYLIRAYLEGAGHDVTVVENGIGAVAAVQADTFDVVLMDVQMPGMDGPTATRAIRALAGPAAGLPIVALTANALAGDREACIAAGMTDYVSKPIDLAALRDALRRAHVAVRSPAPCRLPAAPPCVDRI